MKSYRTILPMLLILAASCGDAEEETTSASTSGTDAPAQEINPLADFKFHSMIANLPSPLQTFNTMSMVRLDVTGVGLTPVGLASNLSTQNAKAYGYGIYMTNMGLMAYQNNNQEVLQYLQACRSLAESLGAGAVFDRTISSQLEQTTGDQEKFVRMMDDAFNAMDQYMVDNERFVNATEIFIGSWVESQLIACQVLKGQKLTSENRPVYEGVFAQKKHASDLMNVLAEIEAFMDGSVVTAIEDLMMHYAGFSSPESITEQDIAEIQSKLEALKAHLLK